VKRLLIVGSVLVAVAQLSFADSGLEHALVKIQPNAPYAGSSSLEIRAARNEYESFQVVVNGPMTGVSVAVSSLTGPAGVIDADSIRCSRVAYMDIVEYSNDEGMLGMVPDALIPEFDVFFGEAREAFPFDVPAGENRLVWVDVFVPEGASPGTYTGTVTVSSSGAPEQLGLTLHVWDFVLPSTSSLPTAFGYEGWGVLFGHYDDPHNHYDQIVPLAQRYLESALMNRLTLSSMLIEDWGLYSDPIQWDAFDQRWGDFFDGKDLAFGLRGARPTTVQIPTWGDTDPDKVAFWNEVAQHFRSRGWFDLLFDYTFDEPGDNWADYQAIIDRAALVHQADPDLRVLVTTDIQEAAPYGVEDIIDIWVPIINFMHGKPYNICWSTVYEGNHRPDYDALVATGKDLWWYQSCMSHGCYSASTNECDRAWPSYMIDHTAIRNRVMGWMSYFYDIRGELYFDVNYCYGVSDPWATQLHFGGNGDGNLYYPGRPDVIGGTTHIPIESVRLKQIRDGLEDYEYFLQLEQLRGRDAVLAELAQVITNTYTYTGDPEAMLSIRRSIGDAISGGELFSDDFESGGTSSWSSSTPSDGAPRYRRSSAARVAISPGRPGSSAPTVGRSCRRVVIASS